MKQVRFKRFSLNIFISQELERIKIRNSELEAKHLARSSVLSPTNKLQPDLGSEIVMVCNMKCFNLFTSRLFFNFLIYYLQSQRICEYIAENQRLQEVNTKLKALCRIRDKKIKELESVAKSQ